MANNRFQEIRNSVRQQKEFFIHFLLWFVGLAGIWKLIYFTDGDMNWFYYALFGWGLVLFVHYLAVFGIPFISKIGKRWEDKEIEKRIQNEIVEKEGLELKELRKNYRNDEFV